MWFRLHTSDTNLAELLYITTETGPGISMANEFQCFVLTKVASKNVIMIILENEYMEITSRWYVNSVIKVEETIRVCRLLAIYKDIFCSSWITRKS